MVVFGAGTLQWVSRRAPNAESTPSAIGRRDLDAKSAGKPGAGKRDAAGAGNVITGAGLRASAKALDVPPDPAVGAPVPDPACEQLMGEIPLG